MTDTNPAALSLAEDIATTAVLEIRRLHSLNQELLEALKSVVDICDSDMQYRVQTSREYDVKKLAIAAIAKAEGESK